MGTPKMGDLALEFPRALKELATLFNPVVAGTLITITPSGNGEPILFLPGFGCDDVLTKPARMFLQLKGWNVHGWENGVNTGPNKETVSHMVSHLEKIANTHNQKVAIVGHSLGGIYARELSKAHQDIVSKVITLGSPFGAIQNPQAVVPIIHDAYQFLNQDIDIKNQDALNAQQQLLGELLMVPPPVPNTAIYTRHDGIVHWKSCINPDVKGSENVEISNKKSLFHPWAKASHTGLIANPLSLLVVADRLAEKHHRGIFKAFNKHAYYPFSRFFRSDQAHHGNLPSKPNKDVQPTSALEMLSLMPNLKLK
jgi:pimeloyl-ACP methyl ester carboxylesterase